MRRASRTGCAPVRPPPPGSAGNAASRCTRAPIAARSATKSSNQTQTGLAGMGRAARVLTFQRGVTNSMAFPGTGKIWMNGELVEWADAKIHIASHVIHYGSGVFEGARCYDTPRGSACFRLDTHLRRLFDSAKIYRMDMTLSYDEVHKAVLDTIKANAFKAC